MKKYLATFTVGNTKQTMEVEAVGILAVIREVRAIFAAAIIVDVQLL